MSPEDKWKVAVAQAPKIPRRSPPTSEPDGAVASTSANQAISAPPTGVRSDSSSTGESGAILDALLAEFEPSGVEREERGWGETLSHEAMEELNQWLQKHGDHLIPPPPLFNGEPRTKKLLPRPNSIGPPNSRPMGMPRHIREQIECEERFQFLTLIAVEPFPEGEMEWDKDETTPSPLRPLESWPSLRGRKQRFNPRQVESQEEAQPSTSTIEPTQPSEEEPRSQEQRRTTPLRKTAVEGRPPSRVPCGARVDESRAQRPSVFSRLGHSQGAAVSHSPDRFPDLRNCPE